MANFQLGEKENQLLHSIYAAALAPEKWRPVIEAIMVHIGADTGQLIFFDPGYPQRNLMETSSSVDCRTAPSGSVDMDMNEIKELFVGWQEGVVILAQQLPLCMPSANAGCINDSKLFPEASVVIPLINNAVVTSSLGFYSTNNQYCLTTDALQFLHRLAPHIAKALQIYNQISAVKQSNLSMVESLRCSNLGVFLLDDRLQVIYTTAEANRIIEKHSVLQINRSNQLEIKDSRQQIKLDEQLRSLLIIKSAGERAGLSEFTMPLRMPDKIHPLKLTAVVLDKQEALGTNIVRLAIFLNDPEQQRMVPLDYLQQAFGLTRTEGAIAQLLLNGCSIADVAAQRKTTLETARWQLKSILHKTGTATQAELIRMLMLLSHGGASIPRVIDQSAIHTTHMGDD